VPKAAEVVRGAAARGVITVQYVAAHTRPNCDQGGLNLSSICDAGTPVQRVGRQLRPLGHVERHTEIQG